MRFKRFLFMSLALAFCCTSVFAHSGDTDWRGGHYDYGTHQYHYHHGYPAHSHINGACPYNFDDQTGWNSGGSSSFGGGSSYSGKNYDNGSLTVEQVKKLQEHYGVTTDGKWGRNSSAAAGGLTADEAWKVAFEWNYQSKKPIPQYKVSDRSEAANTAESPINASDEKADLIKISLLTLLTLMFIPLLIRLIFAFWQVALFFVLVLGGKAYCLRMESNGVFVEPLLYKILLVLEIIGLLLLAFAILQKQKPQIAKDMQQKDTDKAQTQLRADAKDDAERRKIRLKNKQTEFIVNYGGRRLDEIAPPPMNGDHIGTDGLPCGAGDGPWGRYTVYVTLHGKVFHTKNGCGIAYGQAVNLAVVRYVKKPCSRCGGCAPDLRWYDEQKKLLDESKRLFGKSVFENESNFDLLPVCQKRGTPSALQRYLEQDPEYRAQANFYREMCSGRSIWEMAEIPEGVYFDHDDFPHALNCIPQEDPFFVYATNEGETYHRADCQLAVNVESINICRALQLGKQPCKVCKPMGELPLYVTRYQKLKWIQREYEVDMLP